MNYYLIEDNNGVQYVSTTMNLNGLNITPITEEQYNIILDIYAREDEEEVSM